MNAKRGSHTHSNNQSDHLPELEANALFHADLSWLATVLPTVLFGDWCLGAYCSVQIFVILSFLILNKQSLFLPFVISKLTKCLF